MAIDVNTNRSSQWTSPAKVYVTNLFLPPTIITTNNPQHISDG